MSDHQFSVHRVSAEVVERICENSENLTTLRCLLSMCSSPSQVACLPWHLDIWVHMRQMVQEDSKTHHRGVRKSVTNYMDRERGHNRAGLSGEFRPQDQRQKVRLGGALLTSFEEWRGSL